MQQKRNVLSSPRLLELKKRRQRIFLNKVFKYGLSIFLILIFLSYLLSLKQLNITKIDIIGNKTIETEILKNEILNQIAGKYLLLFPKTNIIFYPKSVIKNELQVKFKRIKNINLSIKSDKTLEVLLSERTPLYTWCGNIPILNLESSTEKRGENKCYFMDENGYVFDEAPYFSGEVYFKFYGQKSDDSYFSKVNFKELIGLKDMVIGLSLKATILYVSENQEIEIFLTKGISSKSSPKIILRADSNFQNITENLKTALENEPLKTEFKNKYSSLEYIDLRFGNKVYYKFK